MIGLSSGVEYIFQVDFGLLASVRLILRLNVVVGPFSRLNDGVKSTSALLVGAGLDCWC